VAGIDGAVIYAAALSFLLRISFLFEDARLMRSKKRAGSTRWCYR